MDSSLFLSIESSCDETAAAIVRDGRVVLSDVVCSQVDLHAKWGGVVPEIASRNHLLEVIPVIDQAIEKARVTWDEIDGIAVTQGPGLVGALLVGLQVAKSLAMVHQKPLIPVHHLKGHLSAIALHAPEDEPGDLPPLPHLALVVSGGHTAIYQVSTYDDIRMLAQTQDDAIGEAFDKVSRMLGLGYPGGPVIERLALGGDEQAHRFTLPMIKSAPLDFSYSGLKTAVLTSIKAHGSLPSGTDLTNLLASFQRAAIDQLIHRVRAVMEQTHLKHLTVSGGVACNQRLRERLGEELAAMDGHLYIPPKKWCTDNAAMIAAAAFHETETAEAYKSSDLLLNARSSWALCTPTESYE